MILISHLSTVHSRNDIRITKKQITSLVNTKKYRVIFFIQDGKRNDDNLLNGYKVINTGPRTQSRISRMTIGVLRMYINVVRANPVVAHFHDPELIIIGILLTFSDIKVIYDVHEDLPRQIMGKYYITKGIKKLLARIIEVFENIATRHMDAIVAATPVIAKRFPGRKTIVVQNFPLITEFSAQGFVPYKYRPAHFAYLGGISKERGAAEMITAIWKVPNEETELILAGEFSPKTLKAQLEAMDGWKRVDYIGWASREEVGFLLGNVRAGLVLFLPLPNHLNAQPNKMFEYMAAGLPVIASDFPLWRHIVDSTQCGLLVDPLKPNTIAEAMQWILEHPSEAEAMGQRGKRAVRERYNWERESKKLIALYQRLTKEHG